MERLQGHINHISCGEYLSVESLELEGLLDCHIFEGCMAADRPHQTPVQRMLLEQNQQPDPSAPSSFQLLLRLQEERLRQQQLQHQLPLLGSSSPRWVEETDSACPRPRAPELETCAAYGSGTLSETRDNHGQQHQFPGCTRDSTTGTKTPAAIRAQTTKERPRRRKRSRPSARNMEELECQRMTHIAVERNRRKLMNDHLSSLRSLVPPSFIQRGDQASIVGGSIEYLKGLEQRLQTLLAEKRMRSQCAWSACSSVSTAADASPFHDFFASPQYTLYTAPRPSCTPSSSSASSPSSSSSSRVMKTDEGWCGGGVGDSTAGLMAVADVEATVVHTHVNLKVLSPRRPGQLQRAIEALEDLHLSVLHLNITTFDYTVLYSLNLKIEEECKLGSADEIATAMHQILSLINFGC